MYVILYTSYVCDTVHLIMQVVYMLVERVKEFWDMVILLFKPFQSE